MTLKLIIQPYTAHHSELQSLVSVYLRNLPWYWSLQTSRTFRKPTESFKEKLMFTFLLKEKRTYGECYF
eukprot:c50686_g1_i1 orf=42-248(-)